jgi:hypothetical protein
MNLYAPTDARFLMQGVTVQHLRFQVRTIESIFFENEPGAALRGALYEALARHFCSEPFAENVPSYHKETCPVCWLLAAEDQHAKRGQNIPRPLTLQPPLNRYHFPPNSQMSFGMSLVGRARDMLPYVARAVQRMGDIGVGRGRGRFKLLAIEEVHPLLDTSRTLMDRRTVKQPTLQVTPSVVHEVAEQLPKHAITLELLTPMRLMANDGLVRRIDPAVFVQRLIERCQNLAEHYAEVLREEGPARSDWLAAQTTLLEAARQLRVGYDDTQWVEAFSGSRRTGRVSPIGGLIGRVRWEGELNSLLPWLLWGVSLHVGKNAVKGSGYYRIVRAI